MKISSKIVFLTCLFVLTFSLTYSQSVWTRYPGNPVLPMQNGLVYLHSPSVLYDPVLKTYKMWFVSNSGGGNSISYAVSTDGINWSLYGDNPVLTVGPTGAWDGYSISGPCVIFKGTTYIMYYAGSSTSSVASIGMATSSDGIHWTKREQPVLSATPGTWNEPAVYHPSVYVDGDKYYLWYTGNNGGNSVIGLATSTDGITWINDVNNPILTTSPSGWDSEDVGASPVVKIGNNYYMFYLGTAQCCHFSMGYAISTDGVNWVKSADNPILALMPNSWESSSLGNMSVLLMNDTLKMWYSGTYNGPWEIGYATSAVESSAIAGENISLSVGHTYAFKNDTVSVSVHADFPIGKSYSAFQITLSGFEYQGLTLLGVDTAGTLIGSNGWNLQYNNTDSSLFIASAGALDISGGGDLFNLKFLVDGDPVKTVPVNIVSALFNTGADSVVWINGGVDILQRMLGDVDLNGIVQAYDASLILKHLVGLDTLDQAQLFNADVTQDTSVSAADARSILRYIVGLIPAFPDSSVHGLIPSGYVHFSPIYAQAGDNISFAVNLDGSQNVISSEGLLKYDKTILQYAGTGSSDLLDSFITNNTPGEIRFAGYKNTAADQSGKLVVIKFKVLGLSGTTKITLSKLRLNENRVLDDIGSSDVVLGVDDHPASLPMQYALEQNYPNPFNPTTTISFSIPHDSRVVLKIYNILGKEVATLLNEQKIAGEYSVVWNASNIPSGIYWYRLMSDNISTTRQMVLLK
jgi:hypothetical protein